MSIFKKVTAKFYVDVPFSAMGNLQEAAKMKITERLLKYDSDLQGTVLAYQHARPVTSFPFCYAEAPFCHIRMLADFLVFRPAPGCRLPATVTFVSSFAVFLQIFDCFQANIDLAQLRSEWKFVRNRWTRVKESFGSYDTVIVEVADARPTRDGLAMGVKIVGISSVPNCGPPVDDERLL
jgi:hypothetical protein